MKRRPKITVTVKPIPCGRPERVCRSWAGSVLHGPDGGGRGTLPPRHPQRSLLRPGVLQEHFCDQRGQGRAQLQGLQHRQQNGQWAVGTLWNHHRRICIIFEGGPTTSSCQNSIPSCQNFFLPGGPCVLPSCSKKLF